MARRNSALALIAGCGVLLAIGATDQALAHAKLVSATPGESQTASPPPTALKLKFSEPVEIKLAQVTVVGPDGKPVRTEAPELDPADRNTLVIQLASRLAEGSYTLTWQVVAADSHKTKGSYRFEVKK